MARGAWVVEPPPTEPSAIAARCGAADVLPETREEKGPVGGVVKDPLPRTREREKRVEGEKHEARHEQERKRGHDVPTNAPQGEGKVAAELVDQALPVCHDRHYSISGIEAGQLHLRS